MVRDSSGSPICVGMQEINNQWSIKVLEMKANLEGVKSIVNLKTADARSQKPKVMIESDAAVVIKIINREEESLSKINNLVEEIFQFADKVELVSFDKCSRASNGAAHRLARMVVFDDPVFVQPNSFVEEDDSFIFLWVLGGIIPAWVSLLLDSGSCT